MRTRLTTLCLLLASALMLIASEGTLVFREDFDSPEPLSAWTNNGPGQAEVATEGEGKSSLRVHLDQRGDHLVSQTLPIERVRGSRLTLSARVRAEDVVKAAQPWHGVKVMWQVTTPRGVDYQNVPNLAGTFAGREVSVNVEVPPDATEVRVLLGLGEASGTAWFDDVEATVSAKPRVRPSPQPALLPPEKLDRRIDIPRLRGVMYGPQGKEEDLRALAAWGGNHIRWQFYWYDGTFPEKRLDFALYDRWLEETIAAVDRALPLCRELGIRLVIDLHTPPGAMDGAQMAIFRDAACQQKFIETWDKLARHYRDEPAVWAYDLLNEPAEGRAAPGLMDWRTLAEHVARRIRAIDEKHAIIVEPGPNGGWGNLAFFEPLPLPGIIYSAHVYDPLLYTHQGVLDFAPRGPVYPGMVDGVYWDKAKLREILAPVRAYQQDYNVPIYIGEFSAARWASGASRYLADCIEIFEEYGWDWAYHAFREWHGWNLEIANTPPDQSAPKATTPTDRLRVIQDAMKANKPKP